MHRLISGGLTSLIVVIALAVPVGTSPVGSEGGVLQASAAPVAQVATTTPPSITVAGEGEVRAEPDLAIVTVGVTQLHPTAEGAMDFVSRRLADIIAGAKGYGIADRDVQTTGLSVQPVYRAKVRNDDSPPEIEAYRASNNVSLTVRDLGRASAVLDSAIANGANVIGGLRFSLSNVEELRLQALAAATTNARAKANVMASAAGVTITSVQSIVEEGVSAPRTQLDATPAMRAFSGEAVSVPVEAGEMTVRARVRIVYGY